MLEDPWSSPKTMVLHNMPPMLNLLVVSPKIDTYCEDLDNIGGEMENIWKFVDLATWHKNNFNVVLEAMHTMPPYLE